MQASHSNGGAGRLPRTGLRPHSKHFETLKRADAGACWTTFFARVLEQTFEFCMGRLVDEVLEHKFFPEIHPHRRRRVLFACWKGVPPTARPLAEGLKDESGQAYLTCRIGRCLIEKAAGDRLGRDSRAGLAPHCRGDERRGTKVELLPHASSTGDHDPSTYPLLQ